MQRSRRGTLLEDFEQLFKSDSPQKRGYSFETLLARFLRDNGFKVHQNAKAAKPRQTDMVAEDDGQFLLIETKWKKKNIGSDDIDDLRNRLERSLSDVVGCVFSFSDFSKPAIDEVTKNRKREILLFNAREIYGLFSSRVSLRHLIQEKRTHLRTDGAVWFEPTTGQQPDDLLESLPSESIFIDKAGNRSPWVTRCTGRVEVVFAYDLPYVDNSLGGECVGFGITLHIASVSELRHVLVLANQHFALSGKGSYSIHQEPYAWHGFGVESFLQSVESWPERYAAVDLESYHHSEEISYFDRLEPGMFRLDARQRVSDDPFIHGAEIQIQLPGVPVNSAPFHGFCRDLNLWPGHFESLSSSATDTVDIRERIVLERVRLVITASDNDRDDSISGVIVKNPFYGKRVKFKEDQSNALNFLGQEESIFCALLDWLPANCQPGPLVLKRIDATWVGHAPVLRPACTWESVIEPQSKAAGKESRSEKFERTAARILKSIEVADKFLGRDPDERAKTEIRKKKKRS